LARVQKPLPAIKKILSVKYIYKKTTNKTNRCNKKKLYYPLCMQNE
jgi:hypothetical protein